MIQIQINEKQYNVPTDWKEVTLMQYIELSENATELNAARLLSIFTGINYDVLNNLPCDDFTLKVVPEINFLQTEFDPFNFKRPKVVKIGNYDFEPILDPSRERLGQKLFMQQLVNNAISNNLPYYKIIPQTLACYYAPFIHPEKKWEEKHVMIFSNLVNDMPVAEAFPEANFFLRGYIRYSKKKA